MKITIDTKEDSHEEIKKIIRMLSSLVGHETSTNQGNIFENSDSSLGSPDTSPTTGQNMFNMFDSSPSQSESESSEEEKPEEPSEEKVDLGIPDIREYP